LPQRWDWRLLAAQDQPPPKPTFKSAVDLVPVDVNVIDKSGRPVPDQAAGDFTLTVDGKPRRAVSAQFIRWTAPSTACLPPSRWSTTPTPARRAVAW
jgi:hypothetical protein